MKPSWQVILLLGPLLSSAAYCAEVQKITIGLISTTNPEDTKRRWQPLIDDFAASSKYEVKSVVSGSYADIVNGLKNNTIQVAWMGNKLALDAVVDGKVVVFAQMVKKDGSLGYSSVLITQKNSAIQTLGDVTSKPGAFTFADGDPKSTSGHLIPEFFVFARNKLDPETHFKKIVVGNHQKNLTLVANHEVDLATNNTEELDRLKKEDPELLAKLRVFWTSPQVANDPLLYRTDLPDGVKAKVEEFFYGYGKKQPHQLDILDKILGLSGFHRSSNAQLEPIAKLESFSQLRTVSNNASLTPEQKQKASDEINARLKKLEAVMGPAAK